MKKFLQSLLITGGALLLSVGVAQAINITVPSTSGLGYALVSTTTGAWQATTTDPFHIGAVYATSTTLKNYFAGNVGIGTTNPSTKLHVAGALTLEHGTSGQILEALRFAQTSFPTQYFSSIFAKQSSTAASNIIDFRLSDGTASGQTSVMTLLGSGNVGVGTISPRSALEVVGDIAFSNTQAHTLTRTLPTTVGNEVDIGSFSLTNGTANFDITIVTQGASYSQTKKYLIPASYAKTSGAWQKVIPLSSTGIYNDGSGNQDTDLDININNGVTSFRLRRVQGTIAASSYITIWRYGVLDDTFVPSTSSSAVATPGANYNPATLTQINGYTGVSNADPAEALDITGNLAVSGYHNGALSAATGAYTFGSFGNNASGFSGGNDANGVYLLNLDGIAYFVNGSGVVQKTGVKLGLAKEGTWNMTEPGSPHVNGAFVVYTSSGGSTASDPVISEKFRISSGGNVGVGTTSPAALINSYAATASTTNLLLEAVSKGGCFIMKDVSGTGYTQVTAQAGALQSKVATSLSTCN